MQAPHYRRSLGTYLESAKELARLTAHADRLLLLQRTYAQVAPNYLAEASQVANYKSGKVVIHAASGAVAAKINQLGPSLRDEFCKRGCEVTEIAARVQVSAWKAPRRSAAPPRELPDAAARALAALSGTLPAGSPLAAALQRLLARTSHGDCG